MDSNQLALNAKSEPPRLVETIVGRFQPQAKMGLYVHIPYCISKCPYCDFNSYALPFASLGPAESAYLEALISELNKRAADGLISGRLASIFFGGGTPSMFSADAIVRLIQAARDVCQVDERTEISIEVNPGSLREKLSTPYLQQLRTAGVNRISIGVQSFHEKKLKFLGRVHSASDSHATILAALEAKFENINIDLMFGCRDETLKDWQKDLKLAASYPLAHISAYNLTVEHGTEFGRRQRLGARLTASDGISAKLFRCAQQFLKQRNFLQYEISNYARDGFSCQHNLSYWLGGDFLGLGAGAHSGIRSADRGLFRWANFRSVERYIKSVSDAAACRQWQERLTEEQEELEYFSLRLRCASGISSKDYAERFGIVLEERLSKVLPELLEQKLVELTQDGLRVSEQGMLMSDLVLERIVSEL